MYKRQAVEEGGFRTDAPTAPQLAFHLLCSNAVRRQWWLKTFDVKTALLSGKAQSREIYMKPPPEGLPGVAPGSLLKIQKGAYGLREAPRLWYLKAREVILSCGFEELCTAKACFVLRDKTLSEQPRAGMMILYVDDACYGGEGSSWKYTMIPTGSSLDKATRIVSSEVPSGQRYQPQGAPLSDQEVWSFYHDHHCDQVNAHWP